MKNTNERDVTIDELNEVLSKYEAEYWDEELREDKEELAKLASIIDNSSNEDAVEDAKELKAKIEEDMIWKVFDQNNDPWSDNVPKLAKILESCDGQTVLDFICNNLGTFWLGSVYYFADCLGDLEKYFNATLNWDAIIKDYFENSDAYGDEYDPVGYFCNRSGHNISGGDVFRCISIDFIMHEYFTLFQEYIIWPSGGGREFVEKVAPRVDDFCDCDAHTVAAICAEDDLGNAGIIDMKKLASRIDWKELISWKDDGDKASIAIYNYFTENFPDILKEVAS